MRNEDTVEQQQLCRAKLTVSTASWFPKTSGGFWHSHMSRSTMSTSRPSARSALGACESSTCGMSGSGRMIVPSQHGEHRATYPVALSGGVAIQRVHDGVISIVTVGWEVVEEVVPHQGQVWVADLDSLDGGVQQRLLAARGSPRRGGSQRPLDAVATRVSRWCVRMCAYVCMVTWLACVAWQTRGNVPGT